MSESRREAVLADIARRLNALLPSAAAVDVAVVAAILQGILASGKSRTSATDEAARLIDAAQELVSTRAPGAERDAFARWITRYFDPMSPRRLTGAEVLWLRAVNLQRDRDRRCRLRPVDGCPARLTLGYEQRKLLAEMLREGEDRSAGEYVGRLVERSHYQKVTKERRAADDKARAKEPMLGL